MRLLFDHNVPKKLRGLLPMYRIDTAQERGWDTLHNGELLRAAEADRYDVRLTGDKNLTYQQNLAGFRLALLIIADTAWPTVKEDVNTFWPRCRTFDRVRESNLLRPRIFNHDRYPGRFARHTRNAQRNAS